MIFTIALSQIEMLRIVMKKRYLVIALVALSLLSLFVGVTRISPMDLLDITSEETQIFLISRLPRLIAIILAGAGMSIAGLIMQSLSRIVISDNRIQCPYLLI